MKKKLAMLLLCASFTTMAQNQQFSKMEELPDPKAGDRTAWNQLIAAEKTNLSWGSTDVRYSKTELPTLSKNTLFKATAWKGERVNAQALLWSGKTLENVSVKTSALKSGKNTIPAESITADFVRYVMTDGLSNNCGCIGKHNIPERDSSLVADIIAYPQMDTIAGATARPIWVTVAVPQTIPSGTYKGYITVTADHLKPLKLALEVKVINRTLPPASDWAFHLDLWQNPFSVARYYNVEPWSDAHLELMRPIMTQLANAGQKVVTTTLMHDSWGDQTFDLFGTMVLRTKKMDGSWAYNYDIFDRWVEFMASCGIDEQINCYTVVPWKEDYRYFDEASDSHKIYKCKVGDEAYNAYWIPFLKDFAKHLRQKGWMGKTCLAMDERPVELMVLGMQMIQEADPEFKVALAGNYHKEIEENIFDYCIAYKHYYPEVIKAEREKRGQKSTFYTCCTEAMPNTFSFSAPAEATFLGWNAAAYNYDGYLRWAYNSWSKEPLLDSRWHTFSAADCWLIYPQSRSSIRFERLIEGIQDYEKIRILREEFAQKGASEKAQKLNDFLQKLTPENLYENGAAMYVNEGRSLLNSF